MKKVAVFFANGFEEIEAISPVDILRRGGLDVVTIGVGSQIIEGSKNILIKCDTTIDEVEGYFDAVVIPGGMPGAENCAKSKKLIEIVQCCYHEGGLVSAICAAPAIVLAPSGILDSHRATCYPGMQRHFSPTTKFVADGVVVSGNVITARGPGLSFPFSFEILKNLLGQKVAEEEERKTLYSKYIKK